MDEAFSKLSADGVEDCLELARNFQLQLVLAFPPEKVPHNIERYGNTTAGTLPILFHECLTDGRIKPGMLVCFTALGSGLHWGAALYRV